MFKLHLSVHHGLQLIGCVNHSLCLDFDFWGTPEKLYLKVRDTREQVVGSLELEMVLRKVNTFPSPPESPRSAEPAEPEEPAVPAEPEVYASPAAVLEETLLSATSVSPIPLRQLRTQPDVLPRKDPRECLHYLMASRVKSSGSATLKT